MIRHPRAWCFPGPTGEFRAVLAGGAHKQGVSLTRAHRRIPRRTLVFAAGWRGTPYRRQYEKMREAPDDVVALLTS